MQPSQGVLLDLLSLTRDDLDLAPLQATCEHWTVHDRTGPGETLDRVKRAGVVVTNKVVLNRETLTAARPGLVCVAATGTNNVDLEAAQALGIPVTNVTGYATPSVVQHVFAVILAHATQLHDHHRAVSDGDWTRSDQFCLLDYPIWELAGRTMGIVGYGELGQGVANTAKAFDMRVLVSARPGTEGGPGRVPLPELLPQVDILSLHCPLTDATRDLIGAAELAAMKPDALLINTARGGIVDEGALADALRRGEIGGAAIDVLSVEPPPAHNALLAPGIPNLIVTPHTAWASRESRQRLLNEVAANIQAFSAGQRRNRVV